MSQASPTVMQYEDGLDHYTFTVTPSTTVSLTVQHFASRNATDCATEELELQCIDLTQDDIEREADTVTACNKLEHDLPALSHLAPDSYYLRTLLWHLMVFKYHTICQVEQLCQQQDLPTVHHILLSILHTKDVIARSMSQVRSDVTELCQSLHAIIHHIRVAYQRCDSVHNLCSRIEQYAQQQSTCNIQWYSPLMQELIVAEVMHHPITEQYPPDHYYSYQFYTELVRYIEQRDQEVNDEIYAAVTDGLAHMSKTRMNGDLTETQAPSNISLEYTDASNQLLTVKLRSHIGFHRDVGHALWPAGYTFGEYIIEHIEEFRDMRILGLGSGCGLTEIILHQCTAYQSIIGSDYTEDIVSNMHCNFLRNELNVAEAADLHATPPYAAVKQIDWFDVDADMVAELNANCVISCDTIYLPETHAALANVYKLCLQHGETTKQFILAYMCQPVRNADTYQHYLQAFAKAGLQLTEVDLSDVTHRFKFDRLDMHLMRVSLGLNATPY